MKNEIVHIMPFRLREMFDGILREREDIEEIRIRVNKKIELRCSRGDFFAEEIISAEDIEEMLVYISQYSVYAYEEEIRQGFVTIEGGHRIGFTGQVGAENGKIYHMGNIRFLNIRIARERKGCAKSLYPFLYDGDELLNVLLVSLPNVGKTTFLRDCVRMISDGAKGKTGRKVCVIDERSEIAACHMGIPQNDVGIRTDVLDSCPKTLGMKMAIRSMSPEILAVDELGGNEDIRAAEEALLSGCRVIATMHGNKKEQITGGSAFGEVYKKHLFDRYIFLEKQSDGKRTFQVYDGELQKIC